MVYRQGGFSSISSSAIGSYERFILGALTIDEPGYLYVYVSNESNSHDWVYFNNFKVMVHESPLVQVEDYYPYGLSMLSSWEKPNTGSNRFLFNRGAEKEEQIGLYYTAFRHYDPASCD